MTFQNILRSLWRRHDGLAAVEFALIAPFAIMLFLGTMELSEAMMVERKVTTATSVTADLVGQALRMNDKDIKDVFAAAQAIMIPYDGQSMTVLITSVNIEPDGTTEVGWSDALNTAPREPGSSMTLPDGIGQSNGSVIVSEISFNI